MAAARWRTTILMNLASIVERADEQVLPAVYYFVGRSLRATPAQLGTLTFARALVQVRVATTQGLPYPIEAPFMHPHSSECTSWAIIDLPSASSHVKGHCHCLLLKGFATLRNSEMCLCPWSSVVQGFSLPFGSSCTGILVVIARWPLTQLIKRCY